MIEPMCTLSFDGRTLTGPPGDLPRPVSGPIADFQHLAGPPPRSSPRQAPAAPLL